MEEDCVVCGQAAAAGRHAKQQQYRLQHVREWLQAAVCNPTAPSVNTCNTDSHNQLQQLEMTDRLKLH